MRNTNLSKERIEKHTLFLRHLVHEITIQGKAFSFKEFCKDRTKTPYTYAKAAIEMGIVEKTGAGPGTVWRARRIESQIEPIHGRLFIEKISEINRERASRNKEVVHVMKYGIKDMTDQQIVEELASRGFTGEIVWAGSLKQQSLSYKSINKEIRYKF